MPSYFAGQNVNGYEIVDCINSGVYATAYQVRKGGKNFFLKEYGDPTQGSPEFKSFVAQQDNINKRLCSLKLRNLERLQDTFITSYRYHQIKELLDCIDLEKYLPINRDLDDRLFICRLWLGILKELSAADIVHQDLKPAQILMINDPAVRLKRRLMFADFDWAIINGNMVKLVSTPGYATPEHMNGVTPTKASDLYQTGIVFYQMLTERLPFYHSGEIYDPEDLTVFKNRMERGEFDPPSVLEPVVPEWASSIITAMLTWDIAARPTVEAVILAWDTKSPMSAKAAAATAPVPPPASPIPASVPTVSSWIRLRHDSGASLSFKEGETAVSRQLFHGPFRNVIATSGHPVAAYFPSDDVTPLFTVRKEESGWKIVGGNHRNHGILNGTPLADAVWEPLKNGDRLEIYGRNDSGTVAEFTFEVP